MALGIARDSAVAVGAVVGGVEG